MTTSQRPERKPGDLVTCETVAAIVVHVRRLGPGSPPIRLSGHTSPRPFAMCGSPIDWDTQIPATEAHVSCRSCRKAIGWPEWLAGQP
jgi:hypothetical protein